MAKKSLIRRNKNRKKLIEIKSKKRLSLSLILKDKSIGFEDRLSAQLKLSQMSRNSSSVRYRNRCAVTGRPRGNLRKFGLSRMILRELASWGQVPGLVKSSW